MSAVASEPPPPPPIAGAPRLGTIPKVIAVTFAGALVAIGKQAGVLVLLALLGVPLFAIMGGGAALGWHGIEDTARQHIRFVASDVLQPEFAGSPILVTIPLFTFVGYLMAESRTPERIVRASRAFFGWMPGGLAIVCICASAFFTTLTGASGVTIVAIGGLLYPALRQQKYSDDFSLGLVTSGGSLGLLLPPSIPIIVYSLVAFIPVNETFKAGLLPGFLVMAILAVYSAYIGVTSKIARTTPDLKEMGASLWVIKWELLVPVIILGGLATGLTALDESAAITALYTLCIEVFVYRDLSLKKDLLRIARNSMSLAGAVILILAMANSLIDYVKSVPWDMVANGQKYSGTGVPEMLLTWLETHTSLDSSWKFLIGLNVFLLVIGMLMDGFSAILVAVPLIIPIAATFRMNPFHLAMLFLLNLELAYVCPPLGLNLYIASFRFERPVVSLYRIVLPFVGLLVLALGLVTYVPRISTYLLEGEIETAKKADDSSIAKCERPTYDYDRLSCVQANPLVRKPCNAHSELNHCLSAPSSDPDEPEFADYCVKAYQKTCIEDFWHDPMKDEVCPGKPWAERYEENRERCDKQNGVAPAASASASAQPGNESEEQADEDLLNAMMNGGAASASASASASTAPPTPTNEPPKSEQQEDDELLKEMLGDGGAK